MVDKHVAYESASEDVLGGGSYGTCSDGGSPTIPLTASKDHKEKRRKLTRSAVACKRCRSLKVKCTPSDENDPSKPCLRCLNSGRECEIDLAQIRRKKKKGGLQGPKEDALDSNTKLIVENTALKSDIAKLKSKLKLVTGKDQESSQPDSSPYPSLVYMENDLKKFQVSDTFNVKSINGYLKTASDRRTAILRVSHYKDLINDGVMTIEDAIKRLELYKTILYPLFPFIEISDDLTVDELRDKQPFLFLAIMSVTNCVYTDKLSSDTALTIDICAVRSIAVEVLVAGSKSTELIKAIILLNLWYNTPEVMRNRRYHLLNSLSVSIMYDLGVYVNQDAIAKETETARLEYRKLTLILYIITVNVCITLKRTIYVRWSSFIEESCQIFEMSSNHEELRLVLFTKMCNILERIQNSIYSSEVKDKSSFFSRYLLSQFQRELHIIKRKIKPDDRSLLLFYFTVEAYLYEPMSTACINKTFENDFAQTSTEGECLDEHTLVNVSNCANACLNALNEFNSLMNEKAAVLPIIYYSRLLFSVGILLRLRYTFFFLPLHIEVNLIPAESIDYVISMANKVDESSAIYPINYLLRKTRLILQLFIQTYVLQVSDLLSNELNRKLVVRRPSLGQIDRLKHIIKDLGNPTSFSTFLNESSYPHVPGSLDVLSYAAGLRKYRNALNNKNNISQNENIGPINNNPKIANTYSDMSDAPFSLNTNDINVEPKNASINKGQDASIDDNTIEQGSNGTRASMNLTRRQFEQARDYNSMNWNQNVMGLVDSSQLEDYYSSLNDEFWSELINTGLDKMNFVNPGANLNSIQEDFFFA